MNQYAAIVVIGSNNDQVPRFQSATIANFGEYVRTGGGLILITDHDSFQASVNQLASLFNVEFYASVDRAPISVADTITKHGDHEAWEGLLCKMLPAGGSEGAIRLKQVVPDYRPIAGTVTFAPGETSKEVCVPIIGNNVQQADRTINMNISNPSRGKITTAVGVGTIIDDDSAICKQNPTGAVYQRAGGPDGSYLLHVQPDFNCAAGNVKYLMMANLNFAYTGPYVFNISNDDDFELYIDCKLVASGAIGVRAFTINVAAGTRNVILRYLNIPNCTPGYAGFSVRFNNAITYLTKASDWKGQVNSIGEIESGKAEPATEPCGGETSTGAGYSELYHSLGTTAGLVYIDYATVVPGGTAKNSIDAYIDGQLVATTGGYVLVERGKEQQLSFMYDPAKSVDKRVRVVVKSPLADASSEWWWYKVNCPVAVPATCNSTPEICQVYQELFNRLPDEPGAQFWLSDINANGWDVKTPEGYAAFKERARQSAGQSGCEYMGGTWDSVNNRCILPS